MDQSPKTILLQILDLIEYRDDKELFAQKFFNLVAQETLGTLVSSLPEDKKKVAEDQLIDEKDAAKVQQSFQSTFSQEQIYAAVANVTKHAFQKYVKAIFPVLTATQKQKVQELARGFDIEVQLDQHESPKA